MSEYNFKQLARDEEAKRIMKEAIHEWLEEQFAKFGRWTFYGFLAAMIAGAAYLAFTGWGWHR